MLQGSPGIGTSLLLTLACVRVATKFQRPLLLLCKQRSELPSLTAENALFQMVYSDEREKMTYIWNGVRLTEILAMKTLLVDICDPETLFCIDGFMQ